MTFETRNWDELPPASYRQGAVSIGNFDGVHRGHAVLIAELRNQARNVGGPAVAVTFDPPPLRLLRPQHFQPPLTTIPQRAALLREQGADHVLILQTTPEMLRLSAPDFFERVVRNGLAAKAMVEGINFGFGRNREGNVDTLRTLCREAGLDFLIVPPEERSGGIVSSSRVRTALLQGDVRSAVELLGRPYRVEGRVGTGQQRGQRIGFPTANLEHVETLIPLDGVYAVRVYHDNGVWPGAANIGPNPTFGENARKIEVHLIDFQGDLLGKTLGVEFIERLRDTRPFATVAQLVEQIRLDVERAARVAGPAERIT
jgi:riboflavin kinase/FMN adenylyltransferase